MKFLPIIILHSKELVQYAKKKKKKKDTRSYMQLQRIAGCHPSR